MISVIIPFCNDKAKEENMVFVNAKKQTINEIIQFIVIDYGSDIENEIFLKKQVKDLKNVKYIKTTGNNLAVAYNEAITHVTGEYVVFWEPYSIVSPKFLEKMVDAIQNYDMAICSESFLISDIPEPEVIDDMKYIGAHNREYAINMLLNRNLFNILGNKIFKTKIINECVINFDETASSWGLDELFNLDYFMHVNSCNIIHNPLYEIIIDNNDPIKFDGKRLLTEYKLKLKYDELVKIFNFGVESIQLINTLYINRIYMSVSNMHYSINKYDIEDKMQFIQTMFNDKHINNSLLICDDLYSFSYYFVEYLILAVLDGDSENNYVSHFENILMYLMADGHAGKINTDSLYSAIYKMRKMDIKNNFIIPMLQADIYLSLLAEKTKKGEFSEKYLTLCRQKCLQAMNHEDNLYKYGNHIYDAVSLDLD